MRKSMDGTSPGIRGVATVVVMTLLASCGGVLTSRAGGETPEDAVRGLFEAIEQEDMSAVFDAMAPEEVAALSDLYDNAVETARERGFMDEPSPMPGVDVTFRDLRLDTDELDPTAALVSLVGGDMTYRLTIDELPSGVKEAVDTGSVSTLEGIVPLEGCGACHVMTVLRDGRWYVSPMYTVAQNLTAELGGPAPDFTAGDSPPKGGATASEAVERFLLAQVSGAMAAATNIFDPVSMRVLYDYGDGVDEAIAGEMGDMSTEGSVEVAQMTEESMGGDQMKVYLDHVELTSTVTWGGMELQTEAPLTESTYTTKITIDGRCIATEEVGYDSQPPECIPESWGIDRPFVITVRDANGTWYVSPLDTFAAYGDIAVERMDQSMYDLIFGGGFATTYLGARGRAMDKAAQSSIRNGLVAAKTCFTDASTYAGCDVGELASIEPSLTYVESPRTSTGPNEVSAQVANGGRVWLGASRSDGGTCFYIRDDSQFGTFFGRSTDVARCDAADAAGVVDASW